jgi:hypothetical protein
VADEVSFVGNASEANESAPAPFLPGIPNAYGGNNQNFEEIPSDERLPF